MLHIRAIKPSDPEALARLHTLSWQNSYRGILRDSYLDGPIVEERLALWKHRLLERTSSNIGFLAILGTKPVGFIFARIVHDDRWGTLLDNLHVTPEARGKGIGTALLKAFTDALLSRDCQDGIYLWVFEANHRTRALYERLGAIVVERAVVDAPGGGQASAWRYAWESASQLNRALRV